MTINTKKISTIFIVFVLFCITLAVLVKAGDDDDDEGPPPPPPPPCQIQGAGCYRTGNVKVGFGELTPSEFGYFLPENKCQKSGNCDCRGVPADITQETNPDGSSGACNCIAGADWNAKAKCCGDDQDDCGKISSGILCSIDANAESAQWLPSTQNLGDIRYVGCLRSEYLSDGNIWHKCDGIFWKKIVDNREYICIGKERESIVECCGDGSCKSRVDGKRISTGQSATSSDNKTYYCRPDKKLVTDLDVPDSLKGDRALLTNNKATCEKAGLKWTGTKCCSEYDDQNEYYNDPAGIGGCWDKNPIISVDFVEDTDNSVINYNGEFHGCAIDKSDYNEDNDNLLSLADKHTGSQLITNQEYCFNDPEKNYFCSYTEKWLPTDGTDKTHVSFAPIKNPKQVADCCATDECWDGEKCVENQRSNPLVQPIGNNSRCIDGEWTESELKSTVDSGASGYCPKITQCLANVFGKEESSQCIESGEYIGDNYCENGQWSSRTKLLALKLLKMKSGDYTLFCDNKENTLNTLQYQIGSSEIAASIISNIQANNFCVLKTGTRIIVGMSINKNLDELPTTNLEVFGITSCDTGENDQYNACDATNKVWFNKKLRSFIYSPSAFSVPSDPDVLSSFDEFIANPIKNLIDSLKRLITKPPFDESYVKGIKKFDKLYMSQQGGKSIIASMEGKNFKNTIIEYRNFDDDLCKFLDEFNQAKKDVSSGISCRKEENNYYALVQGSQFTAINPEAIWPDLTSKLRLK